MKPFENLGTVVTVNDNNRKTVTLEYISKGESAGGSARSSKIEPAQAGCNFALSVQYSPVWEHEFFAYEGRSLPFPHAPAWRWLSSFLEVLWLAPPLKRPTVLRL